MDITADTALAMRLDETRKQMNLDTMEDLEKAAQYQGVSCEDFKHNLRNQIITPHLIVSEVCRKLAITKEEMRKFYDEHKSELDQPEQVHLSEILVSTEKRTEGSDEAAQLQAAKAKAESLLEQIKGGAKFEDLAKKDSDGPSAAQGGDLG